MPDNEYVVTIELKVIVDDPESLVVAGAGASALVHPAMPDEMKVCTALEVLLPPPDLNSLPGVRAPESAWTARTTARQRPHRDL